MPWLGLRPRLSKFARVSRSPPTLAPSDGNPSRLTALNGLRDPRPFAPTWPGDASLQAPSGAFFFAFGTGPGFAFRQCSWIRLIVKSVLSTRHVLHPDGPAGTPRIHFVFLTLVGLG